MKKSLGLGRGLDALIDTTHISTAGSSSISEIALDKIYPNPDQPRRNFDEEALQELAQSIKEHGVISPITLRKDTNQRYMIIAGERRFRASKIAGLDSIPAYIRTAKDEQVMEWALIENIQREDLDAIEIALAYQRLMDEYNLTQERMSERVGKKRATVANYLRLLKLPAEIQLGIKEKKIDMGHARAILGSPSPEQQLNIYKRILQNGLSVRKVEELVSDTKTAKKEKKATPTYTAQETALQEKLLLLCCALPVLAQRKSENVYLADSVPLTQKEIDRLFWKPDPLRAVWLGAVLPGAGQIYNRSYWKLPIVYGGFMGCIYAVTWTNNQYIGYKEAYRDIYYDIQNGTVSDSPDKSYNAILPEGYTIQSMGGANTYQSRLKEWQNTSLRNRDMSILVTIAVYALSLIDAYVDAQLFDFDISNDLSLNVSPQIYYDMQNQRTAEVKLAIQF